MADEITVNIRTQLANGSLIDDFRPGTIQIDQASAAVFKGVQNIGTSEEDVTFTGITTEGVCVLYNLDTTNYVSWGKKDGSNNMQAIGRLGASSIPAVFSYEPGTTLRMQANTAACDVLIIMYEA